MQSPYRTAAPYAAVAAVAAGRHQQVTLAVPGRLGTAKARVKVHQAVRKHARALGVQVHARWAACGEDVTEFTVHPGPGRKLLTPALRARVRAAYQAGGVTQRQVAGRFGITQSTVWKIVSEAAG